MSAINSLLSALESTTITTNENGATTTVASSASSPPSAAASTFPPPPAPLDLTCQYAVYTNIEQRILDLVSSACSTTFHNPSYQTILQRIKQEFFHRNFQGVFGVPEHLNVYVAQYLPMRALCYETMWTSSPILQRLLEKDITIYTIGSGPGSEAVGITMAREQSLRTRIRGGKLTLEQVRLMSQVKPTPKFRIHTQDLYDWSSSLTSVFTSLSSAAPLSYSTTHYTLSQSNILDPLLKPIQFKNSHVITMMFVLNELFKENKAQTMMLLDRLVTAMRPGAILIVADSAGDFSQLEFGGGSKEKQNTSASNSGATAENEADGTGAAGDSGNAELEEDEEESETTSAGATSSSASASTSAASSSSSTARTASSSSSAASASSSSQPPRKKRRYWVYTLLDAIPSLSTLYANDSLWYRYPEKERSLKYPLKFENMRYFMRIYQKKA